MRSSERFKASTASKGLMVASNDNYRTLLTNYHAKRINVAEDQAPSLSHIKDFELNQ